MIYYTWIFDYHEINYSLNKIDKFNLMYDVFFIFIYFGIQIYFATINDVLIIFTMRNGLSLSTWAIEILSLKDALSHN